MSELQTPRSPNSPRTRRAPVDRAQMQMVIVGHVDHGKSTIIGRLLADTDTLPDGKLEAVRAACERNSKPFEYAFLIDALKDEQSQGITIDSARVFFKTPARDYIIIDAPGAHRVSEEYGHRREPRRGGLSRDRRARGHPGEQSSPRLPPLDARGTPTRRHREQDGPRRLRPDGLPADRPALSPLPPLASISRPTTSSSSRSAA